MKKNIAVLLVLLMALSLVACGGNTTSETTKAPETTTVQETSKAPETTEAPTTQAPTTKAEPTTEAEYMGEMKIAFGGYVLVMGDFDFSQILTLREDRTCSLLGEEYTWTAQNSTTVKLWKGETFAGTVSLKNVATSSLLWSDPDEKEQKTFIRNNIPEDYSAKLKLAIKEREDDECASEIVFGPQWEVLIGEKTYHAFLSSEQLNLYGDDGSIAFSDRDYGESYKEYPWESGILELFIRITDEHGFHNEGYASYVDESRFDIVELTVDNFMDYFELVSRKESFVLETDGFGDLTHILPLADCVMPKEPVEIFKYTIKFSRKGRDTFDIIYHPSDKTVTVVMTGEDPEYVSSGWTDIVSSMNSNRFEYLPGSSGEKKEEGCLYLSSTLAYDGNNNEYLDYNKAPIIKNAEKVGNDYIWRNNTRMKDFIISRVIGTVTVRKDGGQ